MDLAALGSLAAPEPNRDPTVVMLLSRRFLVILAYGLWQGGFVFYAAVVVPIGTATLGSALQQGLITQQVTNWLNAFGLVWALLAGFDLLLSADRRRYRHRSDIWSLMVILLVVLVGLHTEMDRLLANYTEDVYESFRRFHIAYLWVTTVHWVLGLAWLGLTLSAWRSGDHSHPRIESRSSL